MRFSSAFLIIAWLVCEFPGTSGQKPISWSKISSSSNLSNSKLRNGSIEPADDEATGSIERELSALFSRYSCPSAMEEGIFVSPGLARIKLSSEGSLCMLILTDNNITLYPVARSYDKNDWERYLQLGILSLDMPIVCDGSNLNNRDCEINLPERPGLEYRLFYRKYSLSPEDEYARFLEQTTFGPTRQDIQQLVASNFFSQRTPRERMAQWVKRQQDQTIYPPTLHRAVFRERVNGRFDSSSDIGQVTHPCQLGAYFRRFAFTAKHRYRTLTITKIPNTEYRELALDDGVVYSVVNGPLYNPKNQVLEETLQYEICSIKRDLVGGLLRLKQGPGSDNDCLDIKFNGVYGNPPVFFPPGYVHANTGAVSFNADSYAEPAEQEYYSTISNQTQLVRITDQSFSSIYCGNVIMASGYAPVVTITYNGLHFISDTRFVLETNTVEFPMADGGGSIVAETQGFPEQYVAECSNVPRSFLNEDKCRLSNSLDACWSGELRSNVAGGVVVCGSAGEVANKLELGGEIQRGAFDIPLTGFQDTTGFEPGIDARENVWVYNALWAPDQLRQRVAWALAQILVLNSSVEGNADAETFVTFMDILVRNAFGNYRNILKECMFSPMMGAMLTFAASNSLGSEWIANAGANKEYPDENYAREVMQLFTIGLVELNMDGTQKLVNGEPIQTYSNEDIVEYAKHFTGFDRQPYRGNSAAADGNNLDPMTVDSRFRDLFPKMGLKGEYLGKGYPLCADLPDKPFLKKGAKYRIMGTSPQTEVGIPILNSWVTNSRFKVFQVDPSGDLYKALCAPTSDNKCTFPSIIKLPNTLQCKGQECEVDTFGTIYVANGIHYEYIQPACVQQAFYLNPHKIKRRTWSSRYVNAYMCADPRIAAAGTAMCLPYNSVPCPQSASVRDLFWGERATWSTMKKRGLALMAADPRYDFCQAPGFLETKWGMTQFEASNFMWMSEHSPCFLKIKISKLGEVALFYSMPDEDNLNHNPEREWQQWDNTTESFFRVHWSSKSQVEAQLVNQCVPPCMPSDFDGLCTCDVFVQEEQAFSDPFHTPTRAEVLGLMHGSFHPDFLAQAYTSFGPSSDGVTVHTISSTQERIFQVTDDFGRVFLRKNLKSTVEVKGLETLNFPNPPHFMSLADPTIRDALYESDALLDQVMYHENTAPFLAIRFAQRFGLSNPTPRYVKTIATAFRSGTYLDTVSGELFGDGVYGNMAATIAAVILDREARSVLLNADPSFGSTKEPIVKLMGVMRSLEFQTTPDSPLPRFLRSSAAQWDLQKLIGQGPYMAPDVFGYYLPEFQPDGAIALAGLVAPETQIHTGDNIVGLVNAFSAMAKYGLDRCFGGIGQTRNWISASWYDNCAYRVSGRFVNMSGYFGYNSSAGVDVVDELATLLTAGRLSPTNKQTVKSTIANEQDPRAAVIKAQELILASSEFHTTGIIQKTGVNRPVKPTPTPSSKPYKSVVMVVLRGGCESYNMIVPHTCTEGSPATVDKQYVDVRGSIGLTQEERGILIDVEVVEGQPCSQFALHNNLRLVKELYDQDELSFFMNVGSHHLHHHQHKFSWGEVGIWREFRPKKNFLS